MSEAPRLAFDAPVQASPRGGGALVMLPPEAAEVFGTRARFPVLATFAGEPYRGSTMPMGDGTFCLGIAKAIRERLGVGFGDVVHVVVELDTEERLVEPPPDLAEAMGPDSEAARAFETLPPSHRRAYVQWITGAKRPETRQRRVAEAVSMLEDGRRTP